MFWSLFLLAVFRLATDSTSGQDNSNFMAGQTRRLLAASYGARECLYAELGLRFTLRLALAFVGRGRRSGSG